MNIIARLFSTKDMTVGSPWKKILAFSIPLLIGNVVQQTYNAVDAMVVGKYVGDNALAAVGTTMPLLNLLIVLFVGISSGVSIMVSQYFGAKKREELSVTIGNCISMTAIASLILVVLTPFVAEPLLRLLSVPDSILAWSTDYLKIWLYGSIGFAYFNILSGVLRGMGDSTTPLLYLIVSALLNVVLDLYFVIVLDAGVAGVAIATVISQVVSAILSLLKLLRMKDVFELKPRYLQLHNDYFTRIVRLGLPTGATQAIFSMAMLVVQSLINGFGEFYIAASLVVMRVDGFIMMPNMSFGIAMTTYTGQNIGAKRMDRVLEGKKQGLRLAIGTSLILTLVIVVFGRSLMRLFSDTPELIQYGMRMLLLLVPGYIAMSVTQTLSGVMRGAGDTLTPMYVSIITAVVIRISLAYGLVYWTQRPESIFISLVSSWVAGGIINEWVFRKGSWRSRNVLIEESSGT